VEVRRPNDERERYLCVEEIGHLKGALDEKMYRKAGKGINQTFLRLRLIVLIALTSGMGITEIFGLKWDDLLYREGLIAVRAKLKGGKIRYAPLTPELAAEFRSYPAVISEERIFLLSRDQSASASASTKVSGLSWIWRGSQGLVFTISGTRSRVGT
jgi:integrase